MKYSGASVEARQKPPLRVRTLSELRGIWQCRTDLEGRLKLGDAAANTAAVERREKKECKRMAAEEAWQRFVEAKQKAGDTEADAEVITTLSGASSVEAEPGQPARGSHHGCGGVFDKMDAPASLLKTPSPYAVPGKGNTSPSTARCTPPVLSQNAKMLKLAASCHPKVTLQMQTPRSVQAPLRAGR